MKALYRLSPGKLEIREVPIPTPKSGEVLVKVAYSPINPSDYLFSVGLYSSKKPEVSVCGFEASGTVV